MSRTQRRRIRPKFFFFLLALVALVWWATSRLTGINEPIRVAEGALDSGPTLIFAVVREETVQRSEEYGKVEFLALEGERVAKDAIVAEIYKTGYSEKDVQKLADIQSQILDYQVNTALKGIADAQLDLLDQQIDAKISEIARAIGQSGDRDVLKLERELKTLMVERQQYLRANLTPDDQLTRLYQQEATQMDLISSYQTVVRAPYAGIVSYNIDGLEDTLTPETLSDPDVGYFADLTARGKNGAKVIGEKGKQALFRIVDSAKWYLVAVSQQQLAQASSYQMTIDGLPQTLSGRLVAQKTAEKDTLMVFEMAEDVSLLVNARLISGRIGQSVSGLKVPVGAVKSEEQGSGVYADIGGVKMFVPVEILAKDEKMAIIRCTQEDKQLVVNQKIYP